MRMCSTLMHGSRKQAKFVQGLVEENLYCKVVVMAGRLTNHNKESYPTY